MGTSEQLTYKLTGIEGYTLDEIHTEIANGGRFVIYQYCFSIIMATFTLLTRAHFIKSSERPEEKGFKYTLISLLFGWWAFPSGPIKTIRSVRLNMKGGLDITGDISLALDEESLKNGEVRFEQMHTIFDKVSKDNRKEVTRALSPVLMNHHTVRNAYLALFVNTPPNVKPYFVIGIDADESIDVIVEEAVVALRKRYSRHVPFEFIQITGNGEFSARLVEQGELIYSKGIGRDIK